MLVDILKLCFDCTVKKDDGGAGILARQHYVRSRHAKLRSGMAISCSADPGMAVMQD